MASMQTIIRACGCTRAKSVRTADVKRGWGKFFNKTCKARHQERRTHQNAKYHKRQRTNFNGSGVSKETYIRYQSEFGGQPQFGSNGNYEGFTDSFSNEEHFSGKD